MSGFGSTSDLRESELFTSSVNGLKLIISKILAPYGKPPIKTVYTQSEWAQREIAEQSNVVTYPYASLSLQSFGSNPESYNYNLRRGGITINAPDSDKLITYRLMPVLAVFEITYVSNDALDLHAVLQRWLLRQKDVRMQLGSMGIRFWIKVVLDTQLSPPSQNQGEAGNNFSLTASCTMHTYAAEIETTTRMTRLSIATNLLSSDGKSVTLDHTSTFSTDRSQ